MIYTKEYIKEKMATNDTWLYHGIVAIHNLQTMDEQTTQTTRHQNGMGFNSADAKIMSSFAEQIKARNSLSEKQKYIARIKMPKYSGQLEMLANKNA